MTITGYNFKQNGIFSSQTVLIGDSPCRVINYYTTDGQIVCTTPICTDPICTADIDQIGQYTVSSSLTIYIQTVEGIYSTSSKFIYATGYTPAILGMSHYTWGTATSYVTGYIYAAYLADVNVLIGSNNLTNNAAYIGDPNDLNQELWGNSNYYWWSSGSTIYYRFEIIFSSFFSVLNSASLVKTSFGYDCRSIQPFPCDPRCGKCWLGKWFCTHVS